MVKVSFRTTPDPVASFPLNDAYMRWALDAAEQVVGHDGMAIVLRNAGLERLINNYPVENLEPPGSGMTFGDYSRLNAGLLMFYGRAGKGIVTRIGREAAKKGLEHQSNVFNVATISAAQMMPAATQIKLGLSAILGGFRVMAEKFGQEFKGTIEDAGNHFQFIMETDPVSAGLEADAPIGWLIEGAIEEAARQTFGKFFDVTQVACRSMGAPASIWDVPKQPTETA